MGDRMAVGGAGRRKILPMWSGPTKTHPSPSTVLLWMWSFQKDATKADFIKATEKLGKTQEVDDCTKMLWGSPRKTCSTLRSKVKKLLCANSLNYQRVGCLKDFLLYESAFQCNHLPRCSPRASMFYWSWAPLLCGGSQVKEFLPQGDVSTAIRRH